MGWQFIIYLKFMQPQFYTTDVSDMTEYSN